MDEIYTALANFRALDLSPNTDEMKIAVEEIIDCYKRMKTIDFPDNERERRRAEQTLASIGIIAKRMQNGDFNLIDVPLLYWHRFASRTPELPE